MNTNDTASSFETSWDRLPIAAVQLRPEQVEKARKAAIAALPPAQEMKQSPDQHSDPTSHHKPSDPWPLYLCALAGLGFERWLARRSPEFKVSPSRDRQESQIATHQLLTVNQFRICLLSAESQLDEAVDIPASLVNSPTETAHLYVLAAVLEEQSQVHIHAVLRHDQLTEQRSRLSLNAAGNYAIPLTWFKPDPDLILLYLRCSDPAAMLKPVEQSVIERAEEKAAIASETVVHGTAPKPSRPKPLEQLVINTADWLNGKLDAAAQQLAWTLLPATSLRPVLRLNPSPAKEGDEPASFQRIVTELARRGVHLPQQTRVAYQDFSLEGSPVRLYVLIGSVGATESQREEWQMILVLKASDLLRLPEEVRLWVYEHDHLLTKVSLDVNAEYLFAEVFGEIQESFRAVIGLGDRQLLHLPSFSFQPYSLS